MLDKSQRGSEIVKIEISYPRYDGTTSTVSTNEFGIIVECMALTINPFLTKYDFETQSGINSYLASNSIAT